MLKINLFVRLDPNGPSPDDFNIENLLQEVREDGWQSYIMEGSYPLGISINGIDILGKIACYPFNENLKTLNNLFYNIIKSADGKEFKNDNLKTPNPWFHSIIKSADGKEFKVEFISGLGTTGSDLCAVKKRDNLCLSGKKGGSFDVDFNECVDLWQAVEEVVRVIKEYGEICAHVAKIVSSENIKIFSGNIFTELTWNHDPWFSLEDAWREYKIKNNIITHI